MAKIYRKQKFKSHHRQAQTMGKMCRKLKSVPRQARRRQVAAMAKKHTKFKIESLPAKPDMKVLGHGPRVEGRTPCRHHGIISLRSFGDEPRSVLLTTVRQDNNDFMLEAVKQNI